MTINGFILSDDSVLIYAFTGSTYDGTSAIYATHIYTLTPAT